MIEILGLSFNVTGLALLIFLALIIITQISWWIFKYPFPNRPFCDRVHKNIGGWFISVNKLWQSFEIPTVFGPIAFIMVVLILILNITLLALVFEMFLPLGERIAIPLIGTYGIYTLIAGALFGLVQVAFSLIRKMRKLENDSTRGVTLLITVTIVFEFGMSVWRALMLTSGEQLISPTLWDQATLFGGPILSGLLGIVIPLAEIFLAPYAFFQFIEPIVKDIVLSIRISLSYIGLGIVWILFDFHEPAELETVNVTRYKKDFDHLSNNVKKSEKKVIILVDKLKQVFNILNLVEKQEKEKNNLLTEIVSAESDLRKKNMGSTTKQIIKDYITKVKKVNDKNEIYRLFNSINNELRHILNEIEIFTTRLHDDDKSIEKMISDQDKLKKELEKFEINEIKILNNELNEEFVGLEDQLKDLEDGYKNIFEEDKNYLGAQYHPSLLKNRIEIEKAKVGDQVKKYKDEAKQSEDEVEQFEDDVKMFERDLKKIDTFSIQKNHEMQTNVGRIQNDVEDIRNRITDEWPVLRMELLSRAKKNYNMLFYLKLLFQYKKRI